MHSKTMREATASLTQWLGQHATVEAAEDAGYIGLKTDNPAMAGEYLYTIWTDIPVRGWGDGQQLAYDLNWALAQLPPGLELTLRRAAMERDAQPWHIEDAVIDYINGKK